MTLPEAFTLAMQHHQTGRFSEAAALYRQVVALAPDFVEAYYNLGISLKALGQLDEAITAYRQAVSLRPQFAEALLNLGNALKEKGELSEAIAVYQQALAARPTYAEVHHNLAVSLHELGRMKEAIDSFHRALELSPGMGEAYQNLGNALRDAGKVDEAIDAHRRAMELMPNSADVLVGLGNALREAGRADEAILAYRQALTLAEGNPMPLKSRYRIVNNLLFTLYFDPQQDRRSIWREHVGGNELVRRQVKPHGPHVNDRSLSRRLRIGYVSPDFSLNPVGRFILPLLANHNHRDFEVFCYSDVRVPDRITEQLRACADVWRDTKAHSDEQLVELIGHDAIDILVDLSLHTRDNRLLVFAQKPAPVQVSYLAYCGTTGLEAIDYRLSDRFMDPPGDDLRFAIADLRLDSESQIANRKSQINSRSIRFYSERTYRLPNCFWCFQPISTELPVGDLPALRNRTITLGSLNNYCKVNSLTFSNWCGLLKQVPDSRLVLFAEPGEHRKRAWERFEREGLDPKRLWFTGFLPTEQYLQQYQHIDIALDPFPYGGGTTTFDALWMGVPVVSRAGDTAVSRAGLSILSNLGLAELVASSWEEYIAIAARLAGDISRLAELRATLRQRMQSSPLMDAPRFARDVEAAYRGMWREWCLGPGS